MKFKWSIYLPRENYLKKSYLLSKMLSIRVYLLRKFHLVLYLNKKYLLAILPSKILLYEENFSHMKFFFLILRKAIFTVCIRYASKSNSQNLWSSVDDHKRYFSWYNITMSDDYVSLAALIRCHLLNYREAIEMYSEIKIKARERDWK